MSIHNAQISCLKPTVGSKCSLSSLRILIVTLHNINALNLKFSRNIARVWRIHSYLKAIHNLTARAHSKASPILITYKRSALRHTVTHNIRHLHLSHKLLNRPAERRSANNDNIHLAAQGIHNLLAYRLIEQSLHQRELKQQLNRILLHCRNDAVLKDLLNNKRHGN